MSTDQMQARHNARRKARRAARAAAQTTWFSILMGLFA